MGLQVRRVEEVVEVEVVVGVRAVEVVEVVELLLVRPPRPILRVPDQVRCLFLTVVRKKKFRVS